jgi:hypothetical protein
MMRASTAEGRRKREGAEMTIALAIHEQKHRGATRPRSACKHKRRRDMTSQMARSSNTLYCQGA